MMGNFKILAKALLITLAGLPADNLNIQSFWIIIFSLFYKFLRHMIIYCRNKLSSDNFRAGLKLDQGHIL